MALPIFWVALSIDESRIRTGSEIVFENVGSENNEGGTHATIAIGDQ